MNIGCDDHSNHTQPGPGFRSPEPLAREGEEEERSIHDTERARAGEVSDEKSAVPIATPPELGAGPRLGKRAPLPSWMRSGETFGSLSPFHPISTFLVISCHSEHDVVAAVAA